MRITIVEDNPGVAKGIAYVLRDAGHAVDILEDGNAADEFLRDESSDVVILDVNLPGVDGLEILRRLRAREDMRPVLLLTARAETSDRIQGLDAGADDYLIKPFEMSELAARVRALARRRPRPEPVFRQIGRLRFDETSRQVLDGDTALEIPRLELSAFEALLNARGRTLSKDVLLDQLYGIGADVDASVVEVYISRLRKRLRPYNISIRVQRGLGYQMEEVGG
ncbi:response regulator transcription factor [Litoreibacter roseus]|uniref:DNA-binding response regulator n=1 Tax=Litoreibacter roseus TaxID=2601869 RepID=A0A6N6JJF9_9RHOB|nr:response regulator transcription factor [Litoreibacter roseus]GFE65332.1 DNA-binding response regulator [Litoreibacter roseus]